MDLRISTCLERRNLAARYPYVLNVAAGAASLGPERERAIHDACRAVVNTGAVDWLARGKAFDIAFDGDPDAVKAAAARDVRDEWLLDVNVVPSANRRKKLLIADMDSTIVGCECIDELADFVGLKPKVAAITERAMRGELDFPSALRERVALLKGLPLEAMARVYAERVRLNPGARELTATMRANGALCAAGLRRLHLFHQARRGGGRLRFAPGESSWPMTDRR